MKMPSNVVEILLVDHRPQEDLMFWDAMARSLSRTNREGRWICLIVGCDEKVERVLAQNGQSTSRTEADELEIALEISNEVEKTVREAKKNISSRLTDEGVAAVGIMGFERGLFRSVHGEVVAKKGLKMALWPAPAVVPVVMSVCTEENGAMRDVHPITMARSMVHNMKEESRITVISQRVTRTLNLGDLEHGSHELEELVRKNTVSKLIKNVHNLSKWWISGPAL